MNAVELSDSATSTIPAGIVTPLPRVGLARIIVLTAGMPGAEVEWRAASYEQFLPDDAPEDAIYDSLR